MKLTVDRWAERFVASRIDVDANTTKNYRTALRKAGETFGDRDASSITVDEVAGWVAELADKHKAGTVGLSLLTFRLLLDYVGVDPNPARDRRVRKPKQIREEPNPPSAGHVEQVLAKIGAKWRLLFITIEQGALRLGEAVALRWQDVDAANLRLRLPLGHAILERTRPLDRLDEPPGEVDPPGRVAFRRGPRIRRSREPVRRRACRTFTRTSGFWR